LIAGIPIGVVYGLVAYAFTLTYRSCGVFNFGIGQVAVVGALTYISFSGWLQRWPGLIAAVLFMIPIGALVYFAFLRLPERRGADPVILIIITLGLGTVAQYGAPRIWGYYALPAPSLFDGSVSIGSHVITYQRLIVVGLAAVVLVLVFAFERFTTLGKAMIATGVDREAAIISGVDDRLVQGLAWGMSFSIAALAGMLIAPLTSASMGSAAILATNGFSAAIIGGLGNSFGAFVGGIGMGLASSVAAVLLSPGYADAIAFSAVIVFILFRPAGLLGDAKALVGPRA
jgi:branched-chain amino acid transport system permease protein